MTTKEYVELAKRTCCSKDWNSLAANAALGVDGESEEVCDHILNLTRAL